MKGGGSISRTSRILAIERLRAIAALLIIFFHLSEYYPGFYSRFLGSPYSVNLFFVVSGYVVSRSFLRGLGEDRRQALGRFYLRRIFRIVPLAALWCALPLAASRWFNRSGEFYDFSQVAEMVKQIATLRFNYYYASHRHAILGHYWTLMVEEHFYLVLPLFLLCFRNNRSRLVASIIGIAFVVYVLRPMTAWFAPAALVPWYLIFGTHARFHELLAGVAIYLFTDVFSIRPERWTGALASVVSWMMLGLIVFCWRAENMPALQAWTGYPWIFCSCVGLVLVASFDGGAVAGLKSGHPLNRALEYLGSRSYGIYLAHTPVMMLMNEVFFRWALPPRSLVSWTISYFVLLLFVTELFYRWVEEPFIEWGKRVAAGQRSVPSLVRNA